MSTRSIVTLVSFGVMTLLGLIILPFFVGLNYVEPGYVGIVVSLYGDEDSKGVANKTVGTGYVWYSKLHTRIYEYPTYVQRANFSKDVRDDSPTDESITFNSKEGIVVNADVTLHYKINPEMAPVVFSEIRGDNKIVRQYLHSQMRNALFHYAREMSINEIYGAKANELISKARDMLQETTGEKIQIELLSFISEFRMPSEISRSINLTIEAQQNAIAAQNKVVQSKAEAEQKIAQAQGEADSILLKATKQAEANKIMAESLSMPLIMWEAVSRWDGITPKVMSSEIPQMILPESLLIDQNKNE